MNQTSQGFHLDDFLPYKLVKAADQIADSLAQIYEVQFGLTRPEWRVLASLGAREGLTAKALVAETGLDKVRISRTVKGLSDKELVSKQKDNADQRASRLHLTEPGRRLYVTILPQATAWEQSLLGCLSDAEYQSFLTTLDKLRAQASRAQ